MSNCLELKVNIATYLAKLWVLFGEMCPLYQKVLQIYHLFCQPAVMATKYAFTPLLCCQITWTIYQFFSTSLHPDDFKPCSPTPFPVLLLDDVMGDVRYQRPVSISSFPMAWQDFPPNAMLTQQAPTGPSPFSNRRIAESNAAGSPSDKLARTHPTICTALREYHSKFHGWVMIQCMLDHANLTFL